MNKLKDFFLNSKEAKRFYWLTLGGFLGLAIIFLESPEIAGYWFAPFLIAFIQSATKYLNTK